MWPQGVGLWHPVAKGGRAWGVTLSLEVAAKDPLHLSHPL